MAHNHQSDMHLFYAPGIKGSFYTLDERESRHSVKVLRLKKNSRVKLIDGKGNLHEGIVSDPDPRECVIQIESVTRDFEKRDYSLHVAISPLKNPERFEWFVEKSVEIGIDEITPLVCFNTEKPGIKVDRTRGLIVSAMKQSIKAKEPILNPAVNFTDFVTRHFEGKLMIAHCHSHLSRATIAGVYKKGENALVLIGPEGDFSTDEIEMAIENEFIPVHLGRSRLRTETAGIAACHSIYFING
jgi:16S rRNA (uracil1498-N3)-methyltransferase